MIINAVSYSLSDIKSAATPKGNTVKYLTAIDGTDIIINFGARIRKSCTFTITKISQANYLSLTEYLISNAGQKVALRPENSGETLYPDWPYEDITNYYCYILIPKSLQEEDFSVTNNLYTLNLTVELAGVDESDVLPNEGGTSAIDLLLQIDTIIADDIQSAIPTPSAVGQRWMDTDDNVLREVTNIITLATATWTASTKKLTQTDAFENYTFVPGDYIYIVSGTGVTSTGFHKVAGKIDDGNITLETVIAAGDLATGDIVSKGFWRILYTVAADNSTYGFKNGSFYLAAFSTTVYDSKVYRSGLINLGSIKLPGKNININTGPSIEKREGFSFALNNNYNGTKFWKWIIDNDIGFFGNQCIVGIWESGPVYTKISTGRNISSQFDYANYKYKVEPFSLNKNDKFPDSVIEDTGISNNRYDDVQTQFLGKPPHLTYGEHELAALQNISTDIEYISVERKASGDTEFNSVPTASCQINNNSPFKEIYIRKSEQSGKNQYLLSSELIADLDNAVYSIQIISDTKSGSENIDETRKIESINSAGSDYYVLTIDEAFTTQPDAGGADPPNTLDYLTIKIAKRKYQFQIDEEICGGFGRSVGSSFTEVFELFGLDDTGKFIKKLPDSEYIINADKNLVLLNPRTSVDESKVAVHGPVDFGGWKPILWQKGVLGFADINEGSTENLDLNAQMPNVDLTPPGSITNITETDFKQMKRAATSTYSYAYTAYMKGGSETPRGDILASGETSPKSLKIRRYSHLNPKQDLNISDALGENTFVHAISFPVARNATNEAKFNSSTNIKLCMNLEINSFVKTIYSDGKFRYFNAPFKLILRFKKKNGDYVDSDGWKHDFEANETSLGVSLDIEKTIGKIKLNNFPDGLLNNGGFRESTTSLTSRYSYQISYIFPGTATVSQVEGDFLWNKTDNKLYEYSGGSWGLSGDNPIDNGTRMKLMSSGGTLSEMWEVVGGVLTRLSTAQEEDERNILYQGRDIFDLSTKPFGDDQVWDEVTDVEFLIVNKSLSNQFSSTDPMPSNINWYVGLEFIKGPELYYEQEIETIDKPLFAPARGRTFSGIFSSEPEAIVTDIMNSPSMYLNQWDATSITSLMALSTRSGWNWRRQFTQDLSTKATLNELLQNLWACAVIDVDDKISFKSMNPDDYPQGSPTRTFDDSNILVDSLSPPKFRRTNEIFTEYHLNWDYYIPSEFSAALQKYNENTLIDSNTGSTQIKRFIGISKDIYKIRNNLKMDFKYHYESLPLAEWVAKWFVLNVWQFKFKVSIKEVLEPTPLAIMDFVKVNSHFHTDDEDVEGFVTMIRIDIYAGTAEIGVHVYQPPGVFGPLCDNFNNALNTDRDITGWTNENGKMNSAGSTGRTIGDYTIKDAGSSPRELTC